jgi:Fe-S-cluster-containing hydrogenase component 2
LSLLPYFVLALAVYYVVNGAAFIVCRYDPFVGFYRLSGPAPMILLGVVLLGLSVFVGRPYCRFGCPYGVLLRWTSVLAWRHVQTTPDDCMVCRLCEEACPFGAIQRPDAEPTQEKRATGRRRLGWMLLLLPVVVAVGAWTGHRLAPTLSALHPTIQLASLVQKFDAGQIPVIPVEVETFRASGQTADSLVTEVKRVRDRFNRTGWWLGGFLGMVVGLDLVRLSIYRRRAVYEVNRALCVSCGRCFQYCPKEHARLKKQKETQSR